MKGYDDEVMKRWFILLLLITMSMWVHVPDWWWATHVSDGSWFTGQASWVDHIDLSLYFRVIRNGMEHGDFAIPNMADSTNTTTTMLYPVYTLIGILAKPFTQNPIIAFHIAGFVTGIALMLVALWFIGLFVKHETWRLLGWYWLFLGGGVGWMGYPDTILPDIGVPIFNVWSALRSPHEAVMMMALMLFLGTSFCFFSCKKIQPRWLWRVGLATGAISVSHPQTLVPLGLIGTIFGSLSVKKHITDKRLWMWIVTIMGTFGLYYAAIGKTIISSPMTLGLRTQTTYVFSPWYWLAGWGVMGLLMLSGWRHYKKNLFLWVWLTTQLVLFYLPFVPYRGMMIRGVWVVVTLLAVRGTEVLAKKYSWKMMRLGLVILAVSLGDVFFIYNKRMDSGHIQKTAFISQADGLMMDYLFTQGQWGEGIIGSYKMANLAMGHTRLTPYAGHYPLTPHFADRYPEVIKFYQQRMTDAEAQAWLKRSNISWVMMGKEEQQLAHVPTLSYSFLEEVWSVQGIRLYRPTF